MSPSFIRATSFKYCRECLIHSYAGTVRAVTPPVVMSLTGMETPNTLQESQTCVSSSGVDKSAYSATEDPGSISVKELPLCWVLHRGLLRGILLISPVVRTWDRSAKMEGENHTRAWAMLSQHHWTVCPVERSAFLTSLWPLTPEFLPPALCCLLCPAYLSVCPCQSQNSATALVLKLKWHFTQRADSCHEQEQKKAKPAHPAKSLNEMQLLVSCFIDKWPGTEAKAA